MDVVPLEKVLEDEDDDNSFDHRDDMSESLPTVDGGSGSQRGDEVDDGTSKAKKAKTGGKKAGVTLSPKCKIARGKKANCWKHFKVVNVPSKKERGVMETKAKCKFCYRSYVYHPGGTTTTLNWHLGNCTQYQNKLAKAKAQDSDWVLFGKIRPILGTMAEATIAFSGSLYPTVNCFYPYIVKVKRALIGAQQSGDTYLMSMAAAMLEKFDKYWEEKNNVMVIATILDPRFKMRYIKWCFVQIFDPVRCEIEINDINQELERLYNKYEILNRQKMGDNGTNRQSTLASLDTTSSMASIASDFQSFLQSSVTESSKSELLIYLDEPNEPIDNKHFNLLRYWNVNCHRFPVVSSLAKRFLVVPVSSVSSECTFSNAGRVLDDYRSSLKPATVHALVCASSWIRGTYDDNNHPLVVGDDEDDVESIEFPKCMVSSN
ncbi:zinc finger BED domain-containing protein RICESLEEPER 2-like [Miscanthus floridulus]|uniref:zinc finger BED domain-containing protein RICESLEEPER 2-like n=1 Tax=Miscanthus floridulus TaxID=154761 RepID=UPI0034598BC9